MAQSLSLRGLSSGPHQGAGEGVANSAGRSPDCQELKASPGHHAGPGPQAVVPHLQAQAP